MCPKDFQMVGICLRVKKNNPRFTDLSLGFAFQQFQTVSVGPPNQFFFNWMFLFNETMDV